MNTKQTVLGGHLGLALTGAKTYRSLTGAIGVTSGSTTLTGVGSNFDPDVVVGQTIAVKTNTDAVNPTITLVTIASIESDTSLTLSSAWPGDTLTGLTGYRENVNLASQSVKPVSGIPANWLSIGTLLALDYKRNATFDLVKAPSPGAMAVVGQLLKEMAPTLEMTLNEVSEAILGSVFGTTTPTDASDFTPESNAGLILGWWQLNYFDQAANKGVTIEQYGAGMVEEFKVQEGQMKPVLKVQIYRNALAIGTTTLASLTT